MTAVRFSVSRSRKFLGLPRYSRRSASVVVETALCMTLIVLPTTLGILQYGVVMSSSDQVEQIAREGARFAAVHCLEPTFDSDENQSNPPSLRYYLKNNVVKNKTTIAWTDIDGPVRASDPNATTVADGYIQVTPGTVSSRTAGTAVSVKVCYPMKRKIFTGKLTPNIGNLDNDYNAVSTFNVE